MFISGFDEGTSWSYAIIVSGCSVLVTISIFLWSVTDLFEKLLTRIQIGTFFLISNTLRAGSPQFVDLSVCMCSPVMNSLRDVTTITEDSVSAGIANCFATQIVEYSNAPGLENLCNIMIGIRKTPLFLLKNRF